MHEPGNGTSMDPKARARNARRLAEDAWETDNPVEQALIVTEALDLDPDCPLALVLSATLENQDPLLQVDRLRRATDLAREEAGEETSP